ncbi:MAG: N-acetyltransferase family protein [Halocynthiibacter sp.]
MSNVHTVRIANANDKSAWQALWRSYQDFYEIELEDTINDITWDRIIGDDTPEMGALLVETTGGQVVGLLNYVIHNITWSAAPVCYLEDLFVDPDARGGGAARALIEHLSTMGRTAGWVRIYWHTARDNSQAQILYNKVAERTGWVRYDLDLD